MKTQAMLPIIAAALALSGCTMIPKYERPSAPIAARYPVGPDTNATPAAAEISWREVFPDERLNKLIEHALTNNLDFRVAILNVEQSRAQYRITRSDSFPHVNGSGSFVRSGAANRTADSWNASLGTTAYELDLFGRVRSLNAQSLEKFLATAEARRSAQISLVAQVAEDYFTLLETGEQLALARQTLAAVRESYALNRATFEAGASSELDLRTAEGQVENANINVLTFERQLALAENALPLLLGGVLPDDLPRPGAFSATNQVAEIPSGLPSELIGRRPDILEAEHTLKAANAGIGAARAQFFPTITLTGSLGTTSSEFEKLFGAGTGIWSFSPQVTLPIFTAGQTRANVDSAKVGAQIEIAHYQKAIQTAFREVADALATTRSYSEQLTAQGALIQAQQRRYELANLRYRQGDDTYLNVLSAQQDLYSAQQNQITAQLNRLTSQIALFKALGGGWK